MFGTHMSNSGDPSPHCHINEKNPQLKQISNITFQSYEQIIYSVKRVKYFEYLIYKYMYIPNAKTIISKPLNEIIDYFTLQYAIIFAIAKKC